MLADFQICISVPLRKIAASESFEEYADAEKELKSHVMPKATSFREWVDKAWLLIHQVNLMKSVCKRDLF